MDPHGVEGQDVDREVDALGRARRRVVVAIRPQGSDTAVRDEPGYGGVQPGLRARNVPRPELLEASGVAGADKEDVALGEAHTLAPLGLLQIGRQDALARFEPAHLAQARHVEEHATADDPVA